MRNDRHHRHVHYRALAVLFPLASLAACAATGDGPEKTGTEGEELTAASAFHKSVCTEDAPGFARCHARVRTDAHGAATSSTTPAGLGVSDLRSAYNIPTWISSSAAIAIVDAYDDPNAEADLGAYRTQFGLSACTTANGCFQKVNQTGASTPIPTGNTGWGLEISLDLAMASAACPSCRILLVEANSSGMSDLGTAEQTAARLGATVISNSWGESESNVATVLGVPVDDSYFNHPGVAIFASSGTPDTVRPTRPLHASSLRWVAPRSRRPRARREAGRKRRGRGRAPGAPRRG